MRTVRLGRLYLFLSVICEIIPHLFMQCNIMIHIHMHSLQIMIMSPRRSHLTAITSVLGGNGRVNTASAGNASLWGNKATYQRDFRLKEKTLKHEPINRRWQGRGKRHWTPLCPTSPASLFSLLFPTVARSTCAISHMKCKLATHSQRLYNA